MSEVRRWFTLVPKRGRTSRCREALVEALKGVALDLTLLKTSCDVNPTAWKWCGKTIKSASLRWYSMFFKQGHDFIGFGLGLAPVGANRPLKLRAAALDFGLNMLDKRHAATAAIDVGAFGRVLVDAV